MSPAAASCVWLAERVAGLSPSPALADIARMRLFDALGALAVGRRVGASRVLEGVVAGLAATETGPLDVVHRAASARCTEVDDIDRRSCTTPGPAAVIVPLAVGEMRGVGEEAVLAGVIAGYEAMVRLGMAVDGPNVLRTGIWPSHLGAPLAAAAAASRALGLDVERTAHALAIAATRSVGTAGRIAEEPSSRWLTFGLATADGLLAALAAEQGMVGALDALDMALPAAASVAFDGGRLRAPLGDDDLWAIERVDVKPFATARQTQAAVEAARLAVVELGEEALPDEIEVAVPEQHRAMIDQPVAARRMASLMSAQFQIAAALTDESQLYDVARERQQLSAEGQALMGRIKVVSDAALTDQYPECWGARVTARSNTGRESTCELTEPDGSAERPYGWPELERKHRRLGAWEELERELRRCAAIGISLRQAEEIT